MSGKLKQVVGELGWLGTTLYAVNRVIEKLGGKRVFFDYAIVAQEISPGRPRRKNPFDVHVYESSDGVDELAEWHPAGRAVLRDRFDQGSVCIALERDGEFVACAWLALAGYMEDEVRCRFVPLPEDETGWDFDVYVVPAHRGTMVFLRIWEAASRYYVEHGRRRSLSRISNFNQASLHAHQSMGAEVIGRAVFLVLGPLQLMFSSQRPRLHFGWSKSRYPTVRIETS